MSQSNNIVDVRKFALDKALDYMLWSKKDNENMPSAENIVETAKKFEKFLDGEVYT